MNRLYIFCTLQIILVISMYLVLKHIIDKRNKKIYKKQTKYYNLYKQWFYLKKMGVSLKEYFKNEKISSVAIYGMGEFGSILYDELEEIGIEVKYGIDKFVCRMAIDLKVVSPNDELEKVDAIIVTPVFEFESIKDELKRYTSNRIISLEQVLEEA